MEAILKNEGVIRASIFLGVLCLMCLLEVLVPRRRLLHNRKVRWPSNLGIVILNQVLLRSLLPLTAVGWAYIVKDHSWGLLSQLEISQSLIIIISVLILDLAIYLQHVIFHYVPVLWRLHRMHHADLDFDVTTGSRFHPLEIFLSMGIKFLIILIFGIPGSAVFIFEILLNATAMFNHGNILIHPKIDRILRGVLVTPDMHRIHHSIHPSETNSNFGFNLPWWDRMFGTYRPTSIDNQETMTIGLKDFRNPKYLKPHWLLLIPFLKKSDQ